MVMGNEPLRLVGAHEIRAMLGVSRQRVYQLAGKPDFPKPVARLAQGKIWNLDDIEAWMTTYRSRRRRALEAATPRIEARPAHSDSPLRGLPG